MLLFLSTMSVPCRKLKEVGGVYPAIKNWTSRLTECNPDGKLMQRKICNRVHIKKKSRMKTKLKSKITFEPQKIRGGSSAFEHASDQQTKQNKREQQKMH